MHCRFEAGLTAEQKSAGAQRALAREARAEAAARVAANRYTLLLLLFLGETNRV